MVPWWGLSTQGTGQFWRPSNGELEARLVGTIAYDVGTLGTYIYLSNSPEHGRNHWSPVRVVSPGYKYPMGSHGPDFKEAPPPKKKKIEVPAHLGKGTSSAGKREGHHRSWMYEALEVDKCPDNSTTFQWIFHV